MLFKLQNWPLECARKKNPLTSSQTGKFSHSKMNFNGRILLFFTTRTGEHTKRTHLPKKEKRKHISFNRFSICAHLRTYLFKLELCKLIFLHFYTHFQSYLLLFHSIEFRLNSLAAAFPVFMSLSMMQVSGNYCDWFFVLYFTLPTLTYIQHIASTRIK